MKNRDIMDAMNDIDFDMIEDAGRVTRKSSIRRKVTKWSNLAACLCLVVAMISVLFKPSASPSVPGDTDTPPSGDESGDGSISPGDDYPDRDFYGSFVNLEDFYTFATTGSRNPSDYNADDLRMANTLAISADVDAWALLKLKDMFSEKREDMFSNDRPKLSIAVLSENVYCYVFDDMIVTVDAGRDWTGTDVKIGDIMNVDKDTTYIVENEEDWFDFDAIADTIYMTTVEGMAVYRARSSGSPLEDFHFVTCFEGIKISIIVQGEREAREEWINDPDNQDIMAFFDNERLPAAMARLKTAIEAAKTARPKQ